ncbi:SOS response-associated peptidase [Rhizobium sp. SSA_523]|uniref:SOS response-associated peptidase n=1 Tax=Rhizobium sp. SSA_523 TaxID=2952477 RepID=UPI00209178B5|nr:SOS response-associated peptidase [Rhizobium sp. SSA_523]MCO5730808.1 SOS response-associated peptidase [Rhizobium sp. SSA_523]WKC24368.1 SOS response-associated peptidase [Rhizobium sp. SSA_523]
MCGRFALTATPEEVVEFFSTVSIDDFPQRYNIAPTQPILLVAAGDRPAPGSNQPARSSLLARWGLLPGWVKDPKEFPLLFNARAETAIEKASFRAAMRHRRVLVPASGYYEWHRPEKGGEQKPQAYWIRPKRGRLIALAGLLETFASADGSELDTAAILTTSANAGLAPVHERMPVVIDPQDFDRWLDCKTQEPRDVADLMRPAPDDLLEAVPVSDRVNSVANMGPDLQLAVVPENPPSRQEAAAGKDEAGQLSLF